MNRGTQTSNQIGSVPNFGDVWYNTKSLANILVSMAEVRRNGCRITMDTAVEAAMTVHRSDGSLMKFNEFKSGLYYYDTKQEQTNLSSNDDTDYLFLNTVADNKKNYTQREIEGADRAQKLYIKIERPSSEQEFLDILKNNLIRNCPVTPDDARRAVNIYGPNLATLQGKTVKKQNSATPNHQAIQIPAPIIAKCNSVRIFIDIFWVNGSAYFHTISEWIKFRTVSQIPNRSKQTLLTEVRKVIHMHQTRGITVAGIEGDREFTCVTHDLLPTPTNITDADDHVSEVERSIRTVKERTRCLVHGLPYKRLPRLMIRRSREFQPRAQPVSGQKRRVKNNEPINHHDRQTAT
jgi:hypothetical protein